MSESYRKMLREVRNFINQPGVDAFIVGRTSDPKKTLNRHGADGIKMFRTSCDPEITMDREAFLINKTFNHPKNQNVSPHAGGGVSKKCCDGVYVAYKSRR